MQQDRNAVYIGHLGPIPLYISWTFVFFLFIVAQRTNALVDLETFLIVLTVLLGSIILHELGHGLTAKALGALGITITLGAFGGLCSSTRDRLPRRELMILVAGPAVSFALAGIGYGALYYLERNHLDWVASPYSLHYNLIGLSLAYLYNLNLMLGIFNSLPIFPLDGGQIVFNAMQLVTRNLSLVRQVCMTLAFVGAAGVLAWDYSQSHQLNIYLMILMGWLLFQAHLFLH